MKAKHDFQSDQDYYEYLKHFYAGLALQGIISSDGIEDANPEEIAEACELVSDILVHRLAGK